MTIPANQDGRDKDAEQRRVKKEDAAQIPTSGQNDICSTGHLRTMTQLSEMGAVIAPPVPAFYTQPVTIDDIVTQTVGRALDLFGLHISEVSRWEK